ncbi:MAG: ABC transporter permease [Campylobacteraceae bacterium]|jgi:peptide/nickel transport system permease protein|nr:ABC transporter permease [Campylobacteraceae bacterium]
MKEFGLNIFVLAAIAVFCFIGPFVYGVDPSAFDKNSILTAPCSQFWFGTDRLGRDMLARIMKGGQNSLIIGFAASFVSTAISLAIGIFAGFYRGIVDKMSVVLIDLFLTVPTFFLLLALVSYVDVSAFLLIFIIAISSWMGTARLLRSEVYAINDKPFVKILKIAGVSKIKIILKYYTPILSPILLTSFVFGVSGAILAESSLSFLGLGILPPDMSWGGLLSDGKDVMDIAWWISFFPGLMIFLVTFSLVGTAFKLQNRINAKSSAI